MGRCWLLAGFSRWLEASRKSKENKNTTARVPLHTQNKNVMSKYKPIFWDGNIPKPHGIVANEAAKTTADDQVKQCKIIIDLLNNNDAPKLEILAQATATILFIVSVHGHTCQVIYGLDTGCDLTGLMANDLGDKILVLEGEIDPLFSIPVAHQLP